MQSTCFQNLKTPKSNSPFTIVFPKLLRSATRSSNPFHTSSPTATTSPQQPRSPNLSETCTKLLQSSSCTKTGSILLAKLAHAHVIKGSFQPSLFLLNSLLLMYGRFGALRDAQSLFDEMPQRNVVSYNSLISGYSRVGSYDKALRAFCEARRNGGVSLDEYTYAGVLGVCGYIGDLKLGKVVHGLVVVSGLSGVVFVVNSLIDMYSKGGRIELARLLFETSNVVDDVSWNSLIAGYVRLGCSDEVLEMVTRMHRNGLVFSTYTLGSVLKVCCSKNLNCFGKMVHGYAVKLGLDLGVVVGTALLNMYAKTENFMDAVQIFKCVPYRNDVMYNAMIAGLLQMQSVSSEYAHEALRLFCMMRGQGLKSSKFTFSSILKACIAVEDFEAGKQIHAQICKNNLQSDEFIGSSLVDLYSFFGSVKDGLRCFNSTPKLDVVSWTSMIAGYVQHGQFENSLSLFHQFLVSGRKPDEFIMSSAMSACADMAAAKSGEQIQAYALKSGFKNFTIIQNSQICMYAKSGDIDSAQLTFQETKKPDVISWTVMICSYAQHGFAKEAVKLFDLMTSSGVEPNQVTLLGVLTACSHGGLIDEGLRYFEIIKSYGITTSVKHCACIADLLGRAGRLEDAQKFIFDSGFEDDPVIWRALLGACRVHKDTVMGKRVADRVIELEPRAAASYVLLYNIYNDAGKEMPALEVRKLMQYRGIKKEPGISWIEVGNKVHTFLADDRSHPMSQLIYSRLEDMFVKIKKTSFNNENLPSDIFEVGLSSTISMNHHSEKLAVTFGIIALPRSAPVRVMKNLRVCSDCHRTMKLISKVEKREIILRDAIRFHHFKEGFCSCKDYW